MTEPNNPLESLSLLAFVKGGIVTDNDNFFGLIQGISLDNSRSVADWLCLATGAEVEFRHISSKGSVEIKQTPEALAAKLRERGE